MTFSEFETRLNYYFNSTSERDVYALEEISDGDVYPTMTTEEKKGTVQGFKFPVFRNLYQLYLMKMLKNYSPDAFVEQSREIPEEAKIIHDFVCIIFFEDRIFGE